MFISPTFYRGILASFLVLHPKSPGTLNHTEPHTHAPFSVLSPSNLCPPPRRGRSHNLSAKLRTLTSEATRSAVSPLSVDSPPSEAICRCFRKTRASRNRGHAPGHRRSLTTDQFHIIGWILRFGAPGVGCVGGDGVVGGRGEGLRRVVAVLGRGIFGVTWEYGLATWVHSSLDFLRPKLPLVVVRMHVVQRKRGVTLTRSSLPPRRGCHICW